MLPGTRAVAKAVLPPSLYRFMREVRSQARERLQRGGQSFHLAYHVVTARSFPKLLLYFHGGFGDHLLCTAVARELRKRGVQPVWIFSHRSEIFSGMDDVARVLGPTWGQLSYAPIWAPAYRRLVYNTPAGHDGYVPPQRHIIAELCACAGLTGSVDLRPYLKLNQSEIAAGAWAKDHIAIQSTGLMAAYQILNKQWYPERFQAVVDAFSGEHRFVQLGASTDPLLRSVTDKRGLTSVRETAAILYNARAYVGIVGFLMHLARAVECPSVIIFGGREAPWQSGYPCNINLFAVLPCSPCWRDNTCEFDRKCTAAVAADDVVCSIRELLTRPRSPLATEKDFI